MKARHWLLTIAGVLTVALAGVAIAGGHGGFGRHGHGEFGPKMMRELDLSETQREQVEQALETSRPELEELHAAMQQTRARLHETTPDDPNYSSIVEEVSQQVGVLSSEVVRVAARMQADVYSVLTPEQRLKAAELRDKWHERSSERRERMKERFQDRREGRHLDRHDGRHEDRDEANE